MKWYDKNTVSGQLVAAQTSHGDYKDLHIITKLDGELWTLVSLQDGCNAPAQSKELLIERLNKYQFAPIAKMIGAGNMPENRAALPAVQITGLRFQP